MRKTTISVLLTLLLLSILAWPLSPGLAAAPQPTYQYGETVTPASGTHKLPSPVVANGQLHVAWSTPNQANYASRAETAQGFAIANPPIGSIGSNSTYYNSALAADRNGVVHSIWIDNGGTVRHRSRSAAGWSTVHAVATSQNFANNIVATAASTGRIFAAWRHQGANPDGHIGFTYSDNAGVSWAPVVDVQLPTGTYAGLPGLAAGPNGQVFLTWTGVDGNVYVGEYNSVTFIPTRVSTGTNFFNSTVSVAPNGQPYAAWRNSDNGVYYGYRNTSGQWTQQMVFPHSGVTGPVKIVVDSLNNIHLTWVSQQAGRGLFEAWYSLKTPTDPWTTPFVVSRDGGAFKTNINMVVGMNSGAALAHIFWESFDGGQFIRYAQVKTVIAPPLSGRLTINNGAAVTTQATVNVSITNTSTTSAATYSLADGVEPGAPATQFSNPTTNTTFNLNVADGLCGVHTVQGKLGNGTSVSQTFADTIVYDPSAQVSAKARNPNSAFNEPLNDIGSALVPTGNEAFTREERFNLLVLAGPNECSGLKRYAFVVHGTPRPADDSPAWKTISADGYISANIQFTANAGQGTYQFDVYADDNAGNIMTTPAVVSIIYDTEAPLVEGSTASLSNSPENPGVAKLTISNITVSDNLYRRPDSGSQYWGYWVLVKQTDDGAPTELEWDTYGAIEPGLLSSPLTWYMARGMVGEFQPNTNYTVYIRYLDGAGNASVPLSSQAIPVSQLRFVTHVPLAR